MSKGLTFVLGIIIGALLAIGILFFIGKKYGQGSGPDSGYDDPGISLFYEPGEVLPLKGFRVFQVLSNGTALARSTDKERPNDHDYGDPIVFLMPMEGMAYYDGLTLKVPSGKIVRQTGVYRYETKMEFVKTVPIIAMFDE